MTDWNVISMHCNGLPYDRMTTQCYYHVTRTGVLVWMIFSQDSSLSLVLVYSPSSFSFLSHLVFSCHSSEPSTFLHPV